MQNQKLFFKLGRGQWNVRRPFSKASPDSNSEFRILSHAPCHSSIGIRQIPCAAHKPPHQKGRRQSAGTCKSVGTASIKACGSRRPSQEGWHDKQAIANKPMGLKWGAAGPHPRKRENLHAQENHRQTNQEAHQR